MTRTPWPLSFLLMPLALAACAQPPARDTGGTQPAEPMACRAEAAQSAVGQSPTDAVVQQAQRDAGAASVRVIRPEQPITRDFRRDRLNVHLAADGRIERLRCG